jgi:hypothetical protein
LDFVNGRHGRSKRTISMQTLRDSITVLLQKARSKGLVHMDLTSMNIGIKKTDRTPDGRIENAILRMFDCGRSYTLALASEAIANNAFTEQSWGSVHLDAKDLCNFGNTNDIATIIFSLMERKFILESEFADGDKNQKDKRTIRKISELITGLVDKLNFNARLKETKKVLDSKCNRDTSTLSCNLNNACVALIDTIDDARKAQVKFGDLSKGTLILDQLAELYNCTSEICQAIYNSSSIRERLQLTPLYVDHAEASETPSAPSAEPLPHRSEPMVPSGGRTHSVKLQGPTHEREFDQHPGRHTDETPSAERKRSHRRGSSGHSHGGSGSSLKSPGAAPATPSLSAERKRSHRRASSGHSHGGSGSSLKSPGAASAPPSPSNWYTREMQ